MLYNWHRYDTIVCRSVNKGSGTNDEIIDYG